MTDLITLDQYKEHEGIRSSEKDDQTSLIITSVSQLVKTYCSHSIIDYYTVEKVETFNLAYPSNLVQLNECPINTIVLVEERESYGASYVTLDVGNFDYFLDTATDSLYRTSASGYSAWPKGPGSVRVTYTGGYETVPEDLKLAVVDLVKYYLSDEHVPRQTLSGATRDQPDRGDTYGFPDHIRRVLDLYKVVF